MEGIVERRCDGCIFAKPIMSHIDYEAECHRLPPTMHLGPIGRQQEFPLVYAGDWCGEFKDKWQVRVERVDP